MSVAIIDYGSGNLRSAAKAFERAAQTCPQRPEVTVTSDPEAVRKADRIVLPGVGAFRDCRDGLKAVTGMWEAVEEQVHGRGKPFLGICVGAQLMAKTGLEHGETDGFGWIAGVVDKITPNDPALKIPHMGWNTLTLHHEHALFEGIPTGEGGLHAYFVHSYHIKPGNDADLIAEADYAGPVTAVVARGNFAGTQFHPEKSQRLGLAVISNFLNWTP